MRAVVNRVLVVALAAVVVTGPVPTQAMPLYDVFMGVNGSSISCDGWIEGEESNRSVTLWLYGPGDQFLGVQYIGEVAFPGHTVYVQVSHALVGAGQYRCNAEFTDDYEGNNELIRETIYHTVY